MVEGGRARFEDSGLDCLMRFFFYKKEFFSALKIEKKGVRCPLSPLLAVLSGNKRCVLLLSCVYLSAH